MNRSTRRHELAAAERQLALANANLHASSARLRARIDRHGPLALLGVGAATGAAAGLLPLGTVARAARASMRAALLLVRPIASVWLGALRMHDRKPSTDGG